MIVVQKNRINKYTQIYITLHKVSQTHISSHTHTYPDTQIHKQAHTHPILYNNTTRTPTHTRNTQASTQVNIIPTYTYTVNL